MTPDRLLTQAVADDPARPLITFYDDSAGERVELSVVTFANWVAKTANLLVDGLARAARAAGVPGPAGALAGSGLARGLLGGRAGDRARGHRGDGRGRPHRHRGAGRRGARRRRRARGPGGRGGRRTRPGADGAAPARDRPPGVRHARLRPRDPWVRRPLPAAGRDSPRAAGAAGRRHPAQRGRARRRHDGAASSAGRCPPARASCRCCPSTACRRSSAGLLGPLANDGGTVLCRRADSGLLAARVEAEQVSAVAGLPEGAAPACPG